MSAEIIKSEPNFPFALNSRLGCPISGTTMFETLATDSVHVFIFLKKLAIL